MALTLKELGDILRDAVKNTTDCIGMTVGTGCSAPVYEDIVYVTSEKTFFLIPKILADRLKEGASELSTKLTITNKTERVQALSESGLIQCLATPKLESFLDDADRKQYLDDKWLLLSENDTKNNIHMVYLYDYLTKYFKNDKNYSYEGFKLRHGFDKLHPKTQEYLNQLVIRLRNDPTENNDFDDVTASVLPEYQEFEAKFSAEVKRYQDLDKKARQLATSAGYVIQNEVIYTPEQIKIKELVDSYIKNQKIIRDHEETGAEVNKNIFDAIAEYKTKTDFYYTIAIKDRSYYNIDDAGQFGLLLLMFYQNHQHDTVKKAVEEQITNIIELANFGIAVPEFALGKQDATQGLKQFHALRSLQKQREEEADKLKKQFDIWYKATGSRFAPPLAIFDPYVKTIAELDTKIEDIQTEAEQLVDSMSPPMMLFWDPASFLPKQAEWLVKGNMPLREFTLASDQKNILSHISLYDIVTKGTALSTKLAAGLDKASAHISDLNKDNTLFTGYLLESDAYPIKIKEQWYDKDKGTFKSKDFFKYLEERNFKVKSIETPAQQAQWAEVLNSIIFKESVQRHIMAFDNSNAAAFIRFLGGPKMAQASFDFNGPSMKSGELGGVELKLKVSPAHGQVDLFNFNLPKSSSALHIALPYYNYNKEPRELDFGHFYLNIRAKAWYFAGVSLMLGAKVELAGDNGTLGIKVADEAKTKPSNPTTAGAMAEFDVFAGLEAGIQLTCKLMWKSPPTINSAELAYQKALAQNSQSLEQVFRVLFKGEVTTTFGVGAGLNGKCALMIKNGKLFFAFSLRATWGFGSKVAAEFEVDYRSIMDIVQIVCQALIDNDMQPLSWVEDDALDAILKMSLLGLTFPQVAYWTFWSITKLEDFYNSIFYSGNGGLIGYYMALPRYQKQFELWFKKLPAQAIGPLLWTLTTGPEAFTVKLEDNTGQQMTKDQAIVLQQQGVNLCLSWIKDQQDGPFSAIKPNRAQRLFEASVRRMNTQGVIDLKTYSGNNEYCDNRYTVLEWAMEIFRPKDLLLRRASEEVFGDYKLLVKDLGCHIDNYCHITTDHRGLPTAYYRKDS